MEPREDRMRHLFEAWRSPLLAYALRRTSGAEEAADIVAETFAVAWRRIADIPDDDREVLWLFATTRRVVANYVRKERTRGDVIRRVTEELESVKVNDRGLEHERLSARLALSQLAEDDREILMLAAWEGLDAHQLGIVLSCSPTAARIRLHRARKRLLEMWSNPRYDSARMGSESLEAPPL